MRIYQGQYKASNDNGELTTYKTTVNLEKTLEGFEANDKEVYVIVQGVFFKYKSISRRMSYLLVNASSDFDNDNSNKINLTFNAAFRNDGSPASEFTINYAILVVNSRYIQAIDDYDYDYSCTSSSCKKILDYSLSNIDPTFNKDDSIFFTGNSSWGSTFDSLESIEEGESYYGGGNQPGPYRIKSIRGYSTLNDPENPGEITVNGEVYNQDCADGEKVFPMNAIIPMLFVCMDDRICKAQQGWLDWKNVDPSDDETATDTYIIEKDSFDF